MNRIFAILILALLPLQWSYAVVASYCGHESLPKGQDHLGHHEVALPTDSGDPAVPAPEKGDSCSICSVAALKVAADIAFASIVIVDQAGSSAFTPVAIHDPFPDLPFRPPQSARRTHPA